MNIQLFKAPKLPNIAAALFLQAVVVGSLFPYLAIIATKDFGLSEQYFATVLSVGTVLGMLASFYIGVTSDQSGKRRQWAINLSLLTIIGGLLMIFVPNKLTFTISHGFLLAVGGSVIGLIYAQARVLLRDWKTKPRDLAMVEVRAMFSVPFVLAPVMWSVFIAGGAELTDVYKVVLLSGCGVFLIALFGWPKDVAPDASLAALGAGVVGRQLMQPKIFVPVICVMIFAMGPGFYAIVLGLLFEQLPNRSVVEVGVYVAIIAGLEVPFMILLPRWLSHWPKSRQLWVGAVFYALFLSLMVPASYSWLIWALCPLAGASAAIILSVPISYLQDLLPNQPGAASFLGSIVNTAGNVVGAVILGVGTLLVGIEWIAMMAAVVVLSGAIVFLLFLRSQRKNAISLPSGIDHH